MDHTVADGNAHQNTSKDGKMERLRVSHALQTNAGQENIAQPASSQLIQNAYHARIKSRQIRIGLLRAIRLALTTASGLATLVFTCRIQSRSVMPRDQQAILT